MADDFLETVFRALPERPKTRQTFRQGSNQARSLRKVVLTIFGRERALKFSFSEVEKLSGP